MHLNTFVFATATFVLVNASPAMRRYGNGTVTELPTFASSGYPNMETMPSLSASNSTATSLSITTSNVVQLTTTAVDKTTLTYTLGPSGSSSVVTTVIENTSTITMTSTLYITMTRPADETTNLPTPSESAIDDEPIDAEPTTEPTPIDDSEPIGNQEPTGSLEPTETADLIGSEPTGEAIAEPTGFESIEQPTATDSEAATVTQSFSDPNATIEPTITDSEEPIITRPDDATFIPAEPTVTVTQFLTTTQTVTVEAVPTTNPLAHFQLDELSLERNFNLNPGFWSSIISSFFGAHGTQCGVTTVTTTVVEKSTVTVSPTSTDNFPINPTASPSFGYGNGTDPTAAYPTASSGFLKLHKRSRPTLV